MAPQHRRTRSGRLAVVAASVVATTALASGPGFAAGAGWRGSPILPLRHPPSHRSL